MMKIALTVYILSFTILARDFALQVDQVKGSDQLQKIRNLQNFDYFKKDFCLVQEQDPKNFSSSLLRSVQLAMEPRIIATNSAIDKGYQLLSKRIPMSLISNPLCQINEFELKHVLKKDHQLNLKELKRLKKIVTHLNSLRSAYLQTVDPKNKASKKEDLIVAYSSFMGCLAYTESLTDPDSQASFDAFATFVQNGAFNFQQKPEGVLLYHDRPASFYTEVAKLRKHFESLLIKEAMSSAEIKEAKKKASIMAIKQAKINVSYSWPAIGLFQFSTKKSNNVGPCIAQWNREFKHTPSCQINSTFQELSHTMASSLQSFNAYCGTQKILQSFNTQVHSYNSNKTALSNKTLGPKNRCVSFIARGGKFSYNHFGPLAYSVPKGSVTETFPGNLNILTSCISKSLQL